MSDAIVVLPLLTGIGESLIVTQRVLWLEALCIFGRRAVVVKRSRRLEWPGMEGRVVG